MYQQIISDSENLLADEGLMSLSVLHRRFLRDRLRKAIAQVRTLQQETVAYDSKQHPFHSTNPSEFNPAFFNTASTTFA